MAKRSKKKDPVPALEWVAAALGLVIALALFGIIGREAIRGTGSEVPMLEARVVGVEPVPAGHVVVFEVANRSSQTAAAVQVLGKSAGEESTASIDFVPGRSTATGGLMFTGKPAGQPVAVRVTGYQLP